MPSTLEARAVRPGAEGWPDAWNPVALLRLFPSVDGLEPLGGDAPASVGGVSSSVSLDAFDALAARLAPEPLGGAGDAEGTAEARGKEEGENAAAAKSSRGGGNVAEKGNRNAPSDAPLGAHREGARERRRRGGRGRGASARATRAATRSRARRRARRRERRRSPKLERRRETRRDGRGAFSFEGG